MYDGEARLRLRITPVFIRYMYHSCYSSHFFPCHCLFHWERSHQGTVPSKTCRGSEAGSHSSAEPVNKNSWHVNWGEKTASTCNNVYGPVLPLQAPITLQHEPLYCC